MPRCTGPFEVINVQSHRIVVKKKEGEIVQHSVTQAKPYIPENPPIPHNFEHLLNYSLSQVTEHEDTNSTYDTLITEVLKPNDSRRNSDDFLKAKKKELTGLMKRNK
ncbi:hypothetical protein FGB62_255g020 [Gracilaria domingensis]|nr:hypothetical protein FGB62_255g020 [Gracilaria domingensis]